MKVITNIKIKTAKNGQKYATYTIEGHGNACSFIPNDCQYPGDVRVWLEPNTPMTLLCEPINGVERESFTDLMSQWCAVREPDGLWIVKIHPTKKEKFIKELKACK